MNIRNLLHNTRLARITNSRLDCLAEIAGRAIGRFELQGSRDQWRVDRTRQWCQLYSKHPWRCRVNVAAGVIIFEFANASDAACFRDATAASSTLITCA